MQRSWPVCVLAMSAMALAACDQAPASRSADAGDAPVSDGVADVNDVQQTESVEILETLDREPTFTQGLELLEDGTMVHSRGLYGESGIDILSASGEVVRSRELPDGEFGEGVTVVRNGGWDGDVGDGSPQLTAYQLTWKSGVVHTWSVPDLVEGPSLQIDGDGWGLCYDDTRQALWQSDGTSTLRLLDPGDLAPIATVTVREDTVLGDTEVDQLNELDCSGGQVWANIWRSDDIVLIDPSGEDPSGQDSTGQVLARVSLRELVEAERPGDPAEVLNGIAYDERDGTLLVTGKNWKHISRINVIED